MKFSVDMQSTANAVIIVELSDDELANIATELEVEVKDLTLADLHEFVADKAYEQGVPNICARCSGWGSNHDLELGDEWDIPTDPEDTKDEYRSIRFAE